MQTLWNSSQNAPEMAQPTFSDENIIELEIHDTNIIQKVLRWTRWSGNQVGALKWWGLEIASVENEMGGWLGILSRVDRWCGGPRCGWRSWVGHASSPHFLQGHSLSHISLMVWGMQTGCCWKDKIFKPVARSDWRAFHIGRVRKKVITQAHTDGLEERKELRDLRVWWG